MTRATTSRVLGTLRGDRTATFVAMRFAVAFAVAAVLWASACVFLILEPLA